MAPVLRLWRSDWLTADCADQCQLDLGGLAASPREAGKAWSGVKMDDIQGDGDNAQTVAERLADLARINANLTEGDSPFAASARAVGKAWSGGKMDDITVIVAQVQEAAAGQHGLMSTSPITADCRNMQNKKSSA